MRKIFITLSLCVLFMTANSQTVSVEKSTSGIQTGFFGVWVHKEIKISNKIALRGEVGFDSGIFGGSYYDGIGFLMTPVITIEPRLYYNLNIRDSKGKSISGNCGNFISIKTSYNPDWFVISNHDNINIVNQVSIIPTWGIKRNIGKHFCFETGAGIGYRYYFYDINGFNVNGGEAVLNLHLRIGYRF